MTTIKERLLQNASRWPFSWQKLRFLNRNHLCILGYHYVHSGQTAPHIAYLYSGKSIHTFEKELDYLLHNFEIFAPQDFSAILGKKRKKPAFLLTFDDGLKPMYELIRPLLLKKGVPALFFVNPGFIDQDRIMYRYIQSYLYAQAQKHPELSAAIQKDFALPDLKALFQLGHEHSDTLNKTLKKYNLPLENKAIYMKKSEITQLHRDGFGIGAHSMSHSFFAKIPLARQLEECQASVEAVRQEWPQKNAYFAFPFTDDGVDSSFFDHMRDFLPDLYFFGTAGLKKENNPYHFQRIPMEYQATYSIQHILKVEHWYALGKSLLGKNKVKR